MAVITGGVYLDVEMGSFVVLNGVYVTGGFRVVGGRYLVVGLAVVAAVTYLVVEIGDKYETGCFVVINDGLRVVEEEIYSVEGLGLLKIGTYFVVEKGGKYETGGFVVLNGG